MTNVEFVLLVQEMADACLQDVVIQVGAPYSVVARGETLLEDRSGQAPLDAGLVLALYPSYLWQDLVKRRRVRGVSGMSH